MQLISITIACISGLLLFAFEGLWPGEGARKYRVIPLFFLVAALISSGLNNFLDRRELKDSVYESNLRPAVPDEEKIGLEKRVSELEATLQPFSEIAVAKFPEISREKALKFLKDDLIEPQSTGTALDSKLIVNSVSVRKSAGQYVLSIEFKPVGSFRNLDLTASIPPSEAGRITVFTPLWSDPESSSLIQTEGGKRARLVYKLGQGEPLGVLIALSRPAPLKLEGRYLPAFTINPE